MRYNKRADGRTDTKQLLCALRGGRKQLNKRVLRPLLPLTTVCKLPGNAECSACRVTVECVVRQWRIQELVGWGIIPLLSSLRLSHLVPSLLNPARGSGERCELPLWASKRFLNEF